MTDNEIVKALEICGSNGYACEECLYVGKGSCRQLTLDALALINRLKAEIERLEKAIEVVDFMEELREKQLKRAKADAVKEFAERLKKEIDERWYYDIAGLDDTMCALTDIDNLVKEFTEGGNGET